MLLCEISSTPSLSETEYCLTPRTGGTGVGADAASPRAERPWASVIQLNGPDQPGPLASADASNFSRPGDSGCLAEPTQVHTVPTPMLEPSTLKPQPAPVPAPPIGDLGFSIDGPPRVGTPRAPEASTTQPLSAAADLAPPSAPGSVESIDSFISAMSVPLVTPVIPAPPRLRITRRELDERPDAELIPKRSARLAAKSKFRASKPDAQARKILMKKLGEDVPTEEPDQAAFEEFQVAFKLPLDPSSREGMRELFPGRRGRRPASVPPAHRGRSPTPIAVI